MTDKTLIEAAKEALRLLRNFSDGGIRLYCDDCGGDPDQCPSTCCIPMGMVACEDLEASIAQAEQSASAEDARRIAILSAALHIVRSMPDWDARPDGSLEPFAEMMDMALRGEVHDILSFIEDVHATYPVADGARKDSHEPQGEKP